MSENKKILASAIACKNISNKDKVKLYKKYLASPYQELKSSHLINSFTRMSECGEVRATVSIFHNNFDAMAYIRDYMELEPTWNTSPYDCSGRWYIESGSVEKYGDRIIVKQVECLDV